VISLKKNQHKTSLLQNAAQSIVSHFRVGVLFFFAYY